MLLNEIKKLFLFQSFIAIEQILRWKYLIIFKFPLKYRMLTYYEKRDSFVRMLTLLLRQFIFINVWFVQKYDDDFVFFLYVANDCTLSVNYIKKFWYEGCVYFEYINEWKYWLYYFSVDMNCYVRIYKKIYNISDTKCKYIKYFLKNLKYGMVGYSFDFDISLKNIVIYIRYFMQYLVYTTLFFLFFKQNIWYLFNMNYFTRWKGEKIILANGLHHLTDPLIVYDWCLCWKKFFNFDFVYVKKLMSKLLEKKNFYIISYFFSLIKFREIDDLLNLVLLFIFFLSLKNIKIALSQIYLRISYLLFSNITMYTNYFIYFSKSKDRKKLGKFFFNCIQLVVGKSFVFDFYKINNIEYVKIFFKDNI